jgi:hypothetical protein
VLVACLNHGLKRGQDQYLSSHHDISSDLF